MFITSIQEMSFDTYFRFKKAFNEILSKNIESDAINPAMLFSFASDPAMVDIITAITKLDDLKFDERQKYIKDNWNGEEVEIAIEHFFNCFFLSEINRMSKTMSGIQAPQVKTNTKKQSNKS